MKFINFSNLKNLINKKNLDNFKDEIIDDISDSINKIINEKIKKYSNKNRIINNDNLKESYDPFEILSEEEIKNLPSWIRSQLTTSRIIGNSKNIIQTSEGKKYHRKNPLNDLPGGEWTYFLNSVITTRYPTTGEEGYAHKIRKIHPSPKPPQLMKEIIEFFTKENELILDYFMGVGGTLLGASLSNRTAIGIDLEEKYIEAYKKANKELNLNEQITLKGDSIKLLKSPLIIRNLMNSQDLSLILIDPPYGDMMSREKTGESIKKGKDSSPTPFTNLDTDLGNFTWEKFRIKFKESIINSMKLLKNKGHIVIFIKDLQPEKNNPNLNHADIINDLSKIPDLQYLGTKIWGDLGVNLYPYGYPYSFVANQIHQYILIFRKKM